MSFRLVYCLLAVLFTLEHRSTTPPPPLTWSYHGVVYSYEGLSTYLQLNNHKHKWNLKRWDFYPITAKLKTCSSAEQVFYQTYSIVCNQFGCPIQTQSSAGSTFGGVSFTCNVNPWLRKHWYVNERWGKPICSAQGDFGKTHYHWMEQQLMLLGLLCCVLSHTRPSYR
jgi:hypothetical protein